MKRKVLIVGLSLKIGGIERALVEQLKSIDYSKFDVDLFLFAHYGAYLNEIPVEVKLLKENPLLRSYGLTMAASKENGGLVWFVRLLFALFARVIGCRPLLRLILPFARIQGNYDLAISYFQNGSLNSLYCGCNELVLNYATATKKIAWIHSDYILGGIHNDYNDKLYKRFDAVVNVSRAMKIKFDKLAIVPESKSYIVYNRYNTESCIEKANTHFSLSPVFNIVTVGRLEKEKGIDKLFEVAKKLRDRQVEFVWYFIGTGVLYQWCSHYIKTNDLTKNIVLLGQQSNPFQYVNKAHLCVSGSKSETFGLSILESLILSTPVAAYRYEALDEILDEDNGVIFDSFEELPSILEKIINNSELYIKLKQRTLLKQDYNTLNSSQFNFLINSVLPN